MFVLLLFFEKVTENPVKEKNVCMLLLDLHLFDWCETSFLLWKNKQ